MKMLTRSFSESIFCLFVFFFAVVVVSFFFFVANKNPSFHGVLNNYNALLISKWFFFSDPTVLIRV